ncbi:MAG: thioredoxin domain-containing protein [Deltaproteobacteria bacterium]|nr:thioredoxin domain-containing protein [Deltaproteobacteria bacterium]MCB9788466.1 thioredoxin domain-containing protein [Deltaproteobacteria bacterium]
MESLPEDRPVRPWPLAVALLLLFGGIGLALYLTYVKLRLGYDPTFVSACNFGGKLNCDQVQTHPASEIFGLPLALYAIPTYLVMAFLAFFGLRGGPRAGTATSYLAGLGVLTVLHSAYLAWVSHTQIGFYCPYCIGLYVVNLSTTVLAFAASRRGVLGSVSLAFSGLGALRRPLVPAAIFFVVAGALTVLGFLQARSQMLESAKALIASQMAAPVPAEVAPADAAAATGSDTAAQQTTGAPAKVAAAARPPAARPKPKVTENGLDWFDVPLADDEHSLGPVDAPVTFVAFKDFECGFCRFVHAQEHPLHEKYKDKVRFVFKHYPMNGDCNYRMGGERMHEGACRAAFAASCAQEQGKFWEMNDLLYQNQKRFSDEELRGYAEKLGLDLAAYDACRASDRPKQRIERDVRIAARARINGTPRIYINGRMVTGSTATDVLDYYIQQALENPVLAAPVAQPVTDATPRSVKAQKQAGAFWIDAFEASIDGSGKAVSVPQVKPAMVNWYEAKAACEKAGKRLCSEEEWVSACIGQAATDPDGDGRFTDGAVQGRMYPYGAFYEVGACRDSEDELHGAPGATGANAGCVTPEGVYDLTGNVYEWVGATAETSAMMGGDWRSGSGGTCRRVTTTFGAGYKNSTTGFRCCSDEQTREVATAAQVAEPTLPKALGAKVPDDLVLETTSGSKLSPQSFKGKVTYLTFFASWCGNCKKQMPAIKQWQDEWGAKGFQVVGINVDRTAANGERYIQELAPNFTVALDPSARTMSDFDISAMPTSFIIDRDGVVRERVVGYKEAEVAATRKKITDLL